MKPIHVDLRSDYSSSSSPAVSPNTRFIRINTRDNDRDGKMSAGDTLVILEENLDDGEFWRDEYALGAADVASPENFRLLIEGAFAKNRVNKRVALGADASGERDVLIFVAPPVAIADDPEIEAVFDLAD